MSTPSRSRDPAMDALRVLAIVMVVVIHCASYGLSAPTGSFRWWSALSWASLVRPAVPLFFLCSGALMLGRDIPLRRLYLHNILRIVAAMYFWAFLYRLYHLIAAGDVSAASLFEAVKHTLLLHHEFHFYFLHILLLVYVCLPVTRSFVRNAARREVEYALAVWFVTGILFPLIKDFWPFTLVYDIPSRYLINGAWSSVGYGLLGWYLREYGGTVARRWYWAALALGFAVTFGGCAAASLRSGTLAENFLSGWSPGPMLMSLGVFGLAVTVRRWPERLTAVTGGLAKGAFCVYLVHVFFLILFQDHGVTAARFHPLWAIPVIAGAVLALSYAVYLVLRRVPLVKTWLI